MRTERPYQLALVCGANLEVVSAVAESVVDLTPRDVTGPAEIAQGVLDALGRSNLIPADVRARAVLVADGDVTAALATYAAVVGFAGRHIDVALTGGVVHSERVWLAAANRTDSGKPERRHDLVQLGQVRDDVPSFELTAPDPFVASSADELAEIRHARRARLVAPSTLVDAFLTFASVAGLRARRNQDRFPILAVAGDEPVEVADGEPVPGLIDLDAIRQAAAAHRRSIRSYKADALAEPVALTDRQQKLRQAAAVPVADVLAALGCVTDGELWQCPRPLSHNHGDMTPSMRATDGRGRCYVDDPEWVDSLQLVMSACAASPDEAADLLLAGPDAFAGHRERIAAERAAKAGL